MSHFNELIPKGCDIPFEDAASFFVVIKEASTGELDKEAGDNGYQGREPTPEQVAQKKGYLSGIRSSVASDVTSARRIKRTRGSRISKELGTAGGAVAGFLAGKNGGVAGKLGGTALGAMLGRSAGKAVGEEVDRKRIITRYKPKKAEIEKRSSVQAVRELWKQAEGASSSMPADGQNEIAGSLGEVELGNLTESTDKVRKQTKAPNQPNQGGMTPEQLAYKNSMAQLQQESELDEAGAVQEAEFFRQKAEEAGMAAEEVTAQLEQAQAAAQQSGEQAQMAQQQADVAVQQAQVVQQQMSQELMASKQESMAAGEQNMQLQQSMQDYRKQLQALVLQDPTEGISSPQEQVMADQQAGAMQEQQMQGEQAQAEGESTGAPAQAPAAASSASGGGQGPLVAINQGGGPAAPKKKPAKKPAAQEKTSSAKEHLLGAVVGGLGAAGIQGLSDRKGPGGVSEKEKILAAKVRHLEGQKSKGAISKHKLTVMRALRDMSKTNRENPRSAAAIAAIGGAGTGAVLGPKVIRGGKDLFKAVAARGGK